MAAHLLELRAVFRSRASEGTGSRSAEVRRAGADARAVVLIGRGCGRFVGTCQPGLPCTMSPAMRRSGSAPRRQLGMVGQAGSPFPATSSARPSHRLGSLRRKSLGGLGYGTGPPARGGAPWGVCLQHVLGSEACPALFLTFGWGSWP